MMRSKWNLAQDFSQQSHDLSLQIGSTELLAANLARMGELAAKRGDKTNAFTFFRDARDFYRDMGMGEEAEGLEARMKKVGAQP